MSGSVASIQVSVIVPTYDRADRLTRLLRALASQSFPADLFEVIVVDDGSTDGTAEVLSNWKAPHRLTVLTHANGGPAAARNAGVERAQGSLIVFLDDDIVPEPILIETHVAAHERLSRTVLIGPMLPPPDWRRPAWIRWEERRLMRQYDAMAQGRYLCTYRQFYTGNASIDRNLFLTAGGFDTAYRRAEDVELGYRLHRMGVAFRFESAARAWHYPERAFSAWQRAAFRYGEAEVRMTALGGTDSLRIPFGEFHNRNLLSRSLARACVGHRARSAVAGALLGLSARAAAAMHLWGPADAALSALYNLLFWEGVQHVYGARDGLWAAVDRRHPSRLAAQGTSRRSAD